MLSELIDVNAVKHFRIIDEWSDILSKGSMVVLFDFAYIGCSIFNVYHSVFCPGFQKGRVPSQKGTFSAVNGLSKGHFSAVNGLKRAL